MRIPTLALLIAASALIGCTRTVTTSSGDPPAQTSKLGERERVQGEWNVIKVEWPEKARQKPPPKEMIDGTTITIWGDRITLALKGEEANTKYIVFTEDSTKSPREVNFIETEGKDSREPRKHSVYRPGPDGKPVVVETFPHPPLQAIYKFEGDTLVVAFPYEPEAGRPTEFKATMLNDPNIGETPVIVLHLKKK
ncbi:MAG: TIGR03067 domain-containing protein [Planctomycetia bacterium]|nr:TIGR03067 domain-containing protein [Planctomycetia bacterium]